MFQLVELNQCILRLCILRKRKDKKRDFGSAPFLLASSYYFPLRILLLGWKITSKKYKTPNSLMEF
jgi:hypothetical protein